MNKIIFGLIAAFATAFAALAPAEAGPLNLRFDHQRTVIHIQDAWRIQDGWRTSVVAPPCWVRKSWKRDYAGNFYVRKVRICA